MTSQPLDNTHGRTTLGVPFHHRLWAAHTVERRRAWHAIIALERQTTLTASSVACHHHLWAAQTVERRRAWHAIIAFGQHTRSNDVGRGMHAIIAFGQHTRSNGVGRGMQSSPLDSADGQPSSGVACHHSPWTTHTVGRRRALHAIIAFGQYTQPNDVGRGMPT